MSRNLSSSLFLLLLTVLVAARMPVLGYCECQGEMFLGSSAQCAAPLPVCCDGHDHDAASSDPQVNKLAHCDLSECDRLLDLDVGSFMWQAQKATVDFDSIDLPVMPMFWDGGVILPEMIMGVTAIRGSPAPETKAHRPEEPLYLRYASLRL